MDELKVERHGSITRRLTVLMGAALLTVVVVVGSIVLLEQRRQLTRALETKASGLAQFIAEVSPIAILSLNFVEMNNNVRKVVLTDEEAIYAIISNNNDVPLAYYLKGSHPLVGAKVRERWEMRDPIGAAEALKSSSNLLEVKALINAGERRIGTVTVGFSFEQMHNAMVRQIALIGAVLIFVASGTLLLLEIALRRLLQPVKTLTFAATQISTGNLNVVLSGTDRSDELGVLARAFESMAAQLRASIAGMEQRMTELQRMSLALKKSEEEFRRIVATASEGIWVLGPDTRTTFVNARMAEMLRCAPEAIAGRPMADFIPEDEKADHGQKMANCAQGISENYERKLQRCDGQIVWTHVSSTPIVEAGSHGGSFAMFTDITARKEAEEALARYRDSLEQTVQQRTAQLILARDAAEAASKAKSTFLASMSHELRTPLNAILGFSQIMKDDKQLSSVQAEHLAIINRSGEHLLHLINDVLEMAKIEAGRMQLDTAPLDIVSLTQDVADMMRARAEMRGLYLRLELAPDLPHQIMGDEARLRQILVNLVGNAVKFTEHGGVVIRLGVARNRGGHLVIEVEDTGVGISEADQERIFKPFVQVAEGAEQKGTGLGLTITKQFVDLMRGTISVQSKLGQGALFRVEVPLQLAPASTRSPTRETWGSVVGLAPGQPQYRVLIAEDQVENQLLLSELISHLGIEVRIARNGEECVKLFEEWHPHLIWMDRRMPIMDGVEATRRIRQLPEGANVKIVAVTASAFREQRQEMLGAGMNAFVSKPYRLDEIYECMAQQLGLKYRFESEPSPESETCAVTPEMIAAIPPALKQGLRDALEQLDRDRIASFIDQLHAITPQLAETLASLAQRFDYPAILELLAKGEPT